MLGEPLQHSVRHEIKDFHGALLSSWPLNSGTLEAGLSPVPIAAPQSPGGSSFSLYALMLPLDSFGEVSAAICI
jgi:hypothetical protein